MTLARAALALLVGCAGFSGCERRSDGPARKVALLVGVDRQLDPGITPLPGAAHDVELIGDLLVDHFGFSTRDVLVLTGEAATAEGIRRAFREQLIERSGSGTIAVFHYSGHGRLVADASGDEPDGQDEAIVPYDARTVFTAEPSGDDIGILDDEIGRWLDALVARGASPTLIFDSCYSGSPARGDGVIERSAPPVGLTRGANRPSDHTGSDRIDGGFVVVSAAQSQQTAGEAEDEEGNAVGLFTWALVRALRQQTAPVTWRALVPEVAREVGLRKRTQTPQVDGDHQDRVVFGLASDPPPPGALSVKHDGDGLLLGGGSLHGVTVGSTWRILLPGEPVADVVELTALSARLDTPRNPLNGAVRVLDELSPGTRAVERSRTLRADAPAIAVGDVAPQIGDALRDIGLRTVDRSAPLRLTVDGETAQFEWLDGRPLGPPQPVEPAALSQTAWRLTHWLRLARLEGGYPARVRLELQGARRAADGTLWVRPGDTVRVAVENQEPMRKWHATLLDLSDDGTITRLWPPPGGEQRIAAEQGFTVPEAGSLTITLPAGRTRSIDALKLLLTAEKVDFSPVVRGAADAGGHPLVRWLSATRGEQAGTLRASDWAVKTIWVETCGVRTCPQ